MSSGRSARGARARACCARLWTRSRRAGLARPPLRYPERLGVWPAIAGLVGFAWLELVYVNRDQPSLLAALSLGYFLVMVAGMLLFGVERLGRAGGRVRGVLQPALAPLGDRRRRARRPLPAPAAERADRPAGAPRDRGAAVRDHRHHDVRRLQQRRGLAHERAEPAEPLRRSRPAPDPGAGAGLLAGPGALHLRDRGRSTGWGSWGCTASATATTSAS